MDKSDKVYYLHPIPFITRKDIDKADVFLTNDGAYAVGMDFTKKATKIWEVATQKSYYERSELAFVLAGQLTMVAIAHNGKITSGKSAIIREVYSKDEILKMKTILENEK